MSNSAEKVVMEVKLVGVTDEIGGNHASRVDFRPDGEKKIDREEMLNILLNGDDLIVSLNPDFVIFERVSDGKLFASHTLGLYEDYKDLDYANADYISNGIHAELDTNSGRYKVNDYRRNYLEYIADSLVKCNSAELVDEALNKTDNRLLKLINDYINDTVEHKYACSDAYDEKYDEMFTYSDIIDAFSDYNCIFGIDDDDFFIDELILVNNM